MPCVDCMTDWKPRGESAGARFRAPIGVLRRLEGGRLRLEQFPCRHRCQHAASCQLGAHA